jgi:hypothetical protein
MKAPQKSRRATFDAAAKGKCSSAKGALKHDPA